MSRYSSAVSYFCSITDLYGMRPYSKHKDLHVLGFHFISANGQYMLKRWAENVIFCAKAVLP